MSLDLPEVQDERKVIQIGSSTGVTLSAEALESVGIEQGDSVRVVKLEGDDHLKVVPNGE